MEDKPQDNKFIHQLLKVSFLILACAAVAGANYIMVFPWFGKSGPANFDSIEVSYVTMAKFLTNFSPHLSFAPYWYLGFPFSVFYTPLLPFLEAIIHNIFSLNLWQSYRFVTGLALILAPVSLTVFVWYLTKKIIPAVFAGLFYSFFPSIFNFVLSTGEVADDNITRVMFDARRIVLLARWGEGPHLASLVFLPLAGLVFFKVLRSGKFFWIVMAAVFIGLVAMTNAVGLYGLAILLVCIIFNVLADKPKNWQKILKITTITVIFTYGLIAFWYNLPFMSTFFSEGGGVFKNYLNLFPWGFAFAGFIAILLFILLGHTVKNVSLGTTLVWFCLCFFIVYYYYNSAPPSFSSQRVELAPQALRLMAEVDLAFSATIACLLGSLMYFLEKRNKALQVVSKIIGVSALGLVIYYGNSYYPYAQEALSKQVSIEDSPENKISQWLTSHVSSTKGERVFVGGNYAFYLNYFSDIWQLRGALYQASTNRWAEHIYYQVVSGKDPEIAVNWLKIANTKYIVVNTGQSKEHYKDFKYPDKFSELGKTYESQGDIVYSVPLRTSSPVKVVNLAARDLLTIPAKGDDAKPIAEYANWLDKSKPARFEVINNDEYRINADLGAGEGLLVQMTFDQGFSAKTSDGKPVKISKDPLGFMILQPLSMGDVEIVLKHGSYWKIWLGYAITIATLFFVVIKSAGFLFKPKWKPT